MKIDLIVQNTQTGQIFDISELVSSISWTTDLAGQPGKLTFDCQNDNILAINEGAIVSFKVNDKGLFFGYVFKIGKTKDSKFSVTAYDQLRYLKNQDTYVLSGLTASEMFTKLCKDFNLTHRVVNASSYVVGDRIYDNKSLFDIIDWGVTETMAYTATWYIVRDNFGTLEFVDLNTLKTTLVIGDESLLTNYNYESSIDDDTYNQVKITKENTQTKKREVYIVKDSSTISKWGLLQYFESVDENLNEAQIKERAERLLSLKNRVTKKLKVDCLGDISVSAGSGIVLSINNLSDDGAANTGYYVVTSCTHNFNNNNHTMSLDLQVSV